MQTVEPIDSCPLCKTPNEQQKLIDSSANRQFVKCLGCELVYVPKSDHITNSDEKMIYDYHQNDPEDLGYRNFLNKLACPLSDQLPNNSEGLDFGCGPGPTLSLLLRQNGHQMVDYDPIYRNELELLDRKYDFVCATEVVEHFRNPSESFDLMFSMLKSKGLLGLMTKLNPEKERFSDWHYTRDKTHISFYHERTVEYLANRYQCETEIIGNDVIIMRRLN